MHLSEDGYLNILLDIVAMGGALMSMQLVPLHVCLNKDAMPSPRIMDIIVLPVCECKNRVMCIYINIHNSSTVLYTDRYVFNFSRVCWAFYVGGFVLIALVGLIAE